MVGKLLGKIWITYTESVTILSSAVGCAPCNPLMGAAALNPHPRKQRILLVFTAGESIWLTSRSGWCGILSDALSCHEYVEDSLFSQVGVGESQEAQAPALDKIVTSSVFIIHNLLSNFPGTLHAHPCYQDQECRGLGISAW